MCAYVNASILGLGGLLIGSVFVRELCKLRPAVLPDRGLASRVLKSIAMEEW